MLLNFPVLKLPLSLVESLKLQTNFDHERVSVFIQDEIQSALVNQMIQAQGVDFRRHAQDYGWDSTLDLLFRFYFQKVNHDFKLNQSADSLIKEIKNFCLELQGLYDTENYRCHLLAFYIQCYSIKAKIKGSEDSQGILSTFGQLAKVCRNKKIKSTRPDYLILTLWHYYHFWGEDNFNNNFIKYKDYFQLYQKLSSEQQEHLLKNIANYALSIYDQQMLTEDLVL